MQMPESNVVIISNKQDTFYGKIFQKSVMFLIGLEPPNRFFPTTIWDFTNVSYKVPFTTRLRKMIDLLVGINSESLFFYPAFKQSELWGLEEFPD